MIVAKRVYVKRLIVCAAWWRRVCFMGQKRREQQAQGQWREQHKAAPRSEKRQSSASSAVYHQWVSLCVIIKAHNMSQDGKRGCRISRRRTVALPRALCVSRPTTGFPATTRDVYAAPRPHPQPIDALKDNSALVDRRRTACWTCVLLAAITPPPPPPPRYARRSLPRKRWLPSGLEPPCHNHLKPQAQARQARTFC